MDSKALDDERDNGSFLRLKASNSTNVSDIFRNVFCTPKHNIARRKVMKLSTYAAAESNMRDFLLELITDDR